MLVLSLFVLAWGEKDGSEAAQRGPTQIHTRPHGWSNCLRAPQKLLKSSVQCFGGWVGIGAPPRREHAPSADPMLGTRNRNSARGQWPLRPGLWVAPGRPGHLGAGLGGVLR